MMPQSNAHIFKDSRFIYMSYYKRSNQSIRRLWSRVILFCHHGGKLAMFGNSLKRKRRAVCVNCAISLSVLDAMTFFPQCAGQMVGLKLKYLLQHTANTHAAIRFFSDMPRKLLIYPNVSPRCGKQNGDCYC